MAPSIAGAYMQGFSKGFPASCEYTNTYIKEPEMVLIIVK